MVKTDQEAPSHKQFVPRSSVLLSGLVMACALTVGLLAGAGILGIGIERELPLSLSVAVSVVSVLLPAQSLKGLFGASWRARAGALLLWSCAVVLVLPLYLADFPSAVRSGVSFSLSPVDASLADRVSSVAYAATRRLVDGGRAPLPLAAELGPVELSEKHEQESHTDDVAMQPAGAESGPSDESLSSVVLPVEGQGTSLHVTVLVEGSEGPQTVAFLFDTGATLTTLDRRTLAELGVAVPEDAPVAVLQTANGVVESPIVLLDGLWLGHIQLQNVSVAVCDSCAKGTSRGLLGLNVTGLFDVRLNSGSGEILLDPASVDGDRRLDVSHWLHLVASATMWRMGRVEVLIEVDNSAVVDVSEVVVELSCADKNFAIQLDDIPSAGSRSTEVELPRGTDCRRYSVALRSARW